MVLLRNPRSHPYPPAALIITREKLPLIMVVAIPGTHQVNSGGGQSHPHPLPAAGVLPSPLCAQRHPHGLWSMDPSSLYLVLHLFAKKPIVMLTYLLGAGRFSAQISKGKSPEGCEDTPTSLHTLQETILAFSQMFVNPPVQKMMQGRHAPRRSWKHQCMLISEEILWTAVMPHSLYSHSNGRQQLHSLRNS